MVREFDKSDLTHRMVDAIHYAIGTLNEAINSNKYENCTFVDIKNELKYFNTLLDRIESEKLDIKLVSRE